VVVFTRQLATLLAAGIPLLQGLQVTRQGLGHQGLADLIDQLRGELEAGLSLSQALRKHPRVFPPLYSHLVEAGEASGRLDVLLERQATDLEKTEALRSRVQAALVYPLAVLGVAVLVLVVIMVAVVPSFESVFASFGADLPAATRLVMALSRGAVAQGPWLVVALLAGTWLGLRLWRSKEALRRQTERFFFRTPLIGPLLHQSALARWSRTLSGLLSAGLPLVEAMGSARGAAGYFVYADACARLRDELAQGSSLHVAMADLDLFPAMAMQMCAVGEESGTLDHMLAKLADFHEREVDDRVAGLSSLLEPALILFLGVVIGALVVALYLPIFQMGQIA
jgi:type IV pilus assembly protein PilC